MAQWRLEIFQEQRTDAARVITNDASSLTDADLDEMGLIEGAFDIGAISKAKDNWVLTTAARIGASSMDSCSQRLQWIGGTPCVLIGMSAFAGT